MTDKRDAVPGGAAVFYAAIDTMPLPLLRSLYRHFAPTAKKIEGRKATERLRAALRSVLCSLSEPPPEKERRVLNFKPDLTRRVTSYALGKTMDAIVARVRGSIERWIEARGERLDMFAIGKASGPNTGDALYPRFRDTYSYNGYTTLMPVYEDLGTSKTAMKQREKRALAVEEALQAVFSSHAKWDKTVADSPGKACTTRDARFYVYVAYKLAADDDDDSGESGTGKKKQ